MVKMRIRSIFWGRQYARGLGGRTTEFGAAEEKRSTV